MKQLMVVFLGSGLATTAMADDDRGRMYVSGFSSHSQVGLSASGRAQHELGHLRFEDGYALKGQKTQAHFRVMWRPTERQRVWLTHYEVGHRRHVGLDEPLAFDEWPELSIPAGTELQWGGDLRLSSLMYEYALLQTPRHTFGVQAGAHGAKLSAFASLDIPGYLDARTEWVRERWAPALGMRYQYEPHERWHLSGEVQGYDTSWGNFVSENGDFIRAGILVEYRVSQHWGVHAGYDWFRLRLREEVTAGPLSAEVEGVLRVHGPVLGVTASF